MQQHHVYGYASSILILNVTVRMNKIKKAKRQKHELKIFYQVVFVDYKCITLVVCF